MSHWFLIKKKKYNSIILNYDELSKELFEWYQQLVAESLGKNSKGKMSVTNIELNPKVAFSKEFSVDANQMKEVQERAHRYCFIANSLSNEVKVKIN